MPTNLPLEWVAPRILAGAGALLVLLAVYMTGADSIACKRDDGRVDCRVWRSRVFGLLTVERVEVPEVLDAWVRTSTTSQATYRSGRGATAEHTSSNDTLMLHTRDGRDVPTLGGEQSASYAEQVVALVKSSAPAPSGAADPRRPIVETRDEVTSFEIDDTYLPVALVCGGVGALVAIFGFVGMRFGGNRK